MLIPDDVINYVILPLLIFIARMSDVTLATLRNIFISKGFRKIVPFIGFFEVLIWLIAMKQVMNHVDNVFSYLAWASGFAMGTYVGMRIEERLALGTQVIRIIASSSINNQNLIDALSAKGYGITILDGQGAKGPVKLIFTVVARKNVLDVIATIEAVQPNAFYSIEDVRNAEHGVFKPGTRRLSFRKMFFK